ncbi:DUF6412 domain-containing protein [Micromonospora sp. NBC_01796]|uniref:DUF6412 domain-containing protein n=1 Tax=Micromonospora sp. NBC_01796 TaxID=2975987 RepID=UPI002DD7E3D5|nr:DUF6412 domain-containing protein [Micromonospora sp. NBC_01796]WSA89492.1 DUF6412 domain-containing protein [Micromonospora sp. NBC_01796]
MPESLMVVVSWWAYALAHVATVATRPSELLAGAVAVATLLAVAIALHLVSGPHGTAGAATRGLTIRDRARRARVPRQLDPDAAGRPRPRAPTVLLSAA